MTPHDFIAANGGDEADIRKMRVKVFVVLRALMEMAAMTGDARCNAYRIFGIEDLAASLD